MFPMIEAALNAHRTDHLKSGLYDPAGKVFPDTPLKSLWSTIGPSWIPTSTKHLQRTLASYPHKRRKPRPTILSALSR